VTRAQAGEPLTDLEREVLNWLARGATYARAARMTGVSEAGAKFAADRMVVKMDADNLPHAVYLACLARVLDVPDRSRIYRKKTETRGSGRVRTPD
jgi:DNA-binding CsgD family transcriptional regulator